VTSISVRRYQLATGTVIRPRDFKPEKIVHDVITTVLCVPAHQPRRRHPLRSRQRE